MRAEVDGKVLDDGLFELQIGEESIEVAEPKTNSLSNGLCCIAGIEDSVGGRFGEQVDDGVRQVLDLIDHHIVNFRSFVSSESDDVEDVVDCVHDVVSSCPDLPSLVLAEGFVDVQLLIPCEEGVGGRIDIGVLSQVLAGVLVGFSRSLDRRVNLGPDQVRCDVP